MKCRNVLKASSKVDDDANIWTEIPPALCRWSLNFNLKRAFSWMSRGGAAREFLSGGKLARNWVLVHFGFDAERQLNLARLFKVG